jgi:sugar/nucleoside kinase (ribokinase family)
MTTAMQPYDVLVVGGAGVDTIVNVDALPVPYEDSVQVPPIREWAGHTGTGVALGCRALGMTTGFIDFVGEDRLGDMVRERLAEAKVEFYPLISPAGTRRAVNLVSADGRRMSFYDGRDPLDLRMPPEFYLPQLRRARHVHVSIQHYARFLYDDVQTLGIPVSTDLHDWDGVSEHHREFALRSDLVFFSAARAGQRTADIMRGILRDGRAETVVATDGAAGAYLLTRYGAGGQPRHIPSVAPPGPVVDSNGAGDAFVSGFLHGRSRGRSPRECALLGSVAGAYACVTEGTHTSLIDPAGLAEGYARASIVSGA